MARQKIKKESELRQDPVSGEWVVVAARRAFRPHAVKPQKPKRSSVATCPFENPQKTGHGKPILAIPEGRDWFLQVVPNKFPIVEGVKCGIERRRGIFTWQTGAGFHEIVIFRDHDRDPARFGREELATMLVGYQSRYRALAAEDCAEYILIFHNHGPAAGASVYHPHSQIVALPVIPPDVARSIAGSRKFFESHKKCIHCEMIEWEKREGKRVIYENDDMIVFAPFASKVAFETRIFPKRHEYAFEHMEERQRRFLADALGAALKKTAKVLKNPSYNFFIHTAPTNPEYFSHYHWHIELLPRTSIWAGVELGTGIEVVPVTPEEAARHLRNA